jgi:serine phosphatase RsbU (regulator of sigma subunit)
MGSRKRKVDSLLVELEKSIDKLEENKINVKLGELYLNLDNKKSELYSLKAYHYGVDHKNLELRKKAAYTLAYVYNGNGKYATAIKYFIESDDLCRKTNDTTGMISCQNGLGNLHLGDHNFEQALKHYTSGNELSKSIQDTVQTAITYIGMGNATSKIGDSEKALIYFKEAQKVYTKEKNPFVYASILANMAETYSDLGETEKALNFNFEALEIMEQLDHGYGIATLNQNIGAIYKKMEVNIKAIPFYEKAITKNIQIGALDALQVCYHDLGETYEKLGNKTIAYDYLKMHISIKDSLFNEKNSEIVAEMQKKYDQEINDNKIILLNKENQIGIQDLKVKENQQFYLIGVFIIVLIFLGFLYSRFKITNKQKRIIEQVNNNLNHTNLELGVQRDEILASITYAKRIQNAILPSEKSVKSHLKKSFVLYKPKDIVAGDFYWLEEKSGVVLFAAADCTGHGVPGAMVSVICNNALNRSVREYGILNPGNILDKSREIVIEEFEKSDEEVNDGMDIALCSIEGSQLKYAGAYNPLWIIRNGEIIETKGDKQPIGKYYSQSPYQTHTFELVKGDSIYIFTDGFVDQFGGDKGKKFKVKAFRKLLLSVQEHSMEDQKEILNDTFEKWKNNFQQIDDVCVIGIKY